MNWKTTAAGVASILTSLGALAKMFSDGHFDGNTLVGSITGIVTGVGLILAKDHNK